MTFSRKFNRMWERRRINNLKPGNCKHCGGNPILKYDGYCYLVYCDRCGRYTKALDKESAIINWQEENGVK